MGICCFDRPSAKGLSLLDRAMHMAAEAHGHGGRSAPRAVLEQQPDAVELAAAHRQCHWRRAVAVQGVDQRDPRRHRAAATADAAQRVCGGDALRRAGAPSSPCAVVPCRLRDAPLTAQHHLQLPRLAVPHGEVQQCRAAAAGGDGGGGGGGGLQFNRCLVVDEQLQTAHLGKGREQGRGVRSSWAPGSTACGASGRRGIGGGERKGEHSSKGGCGKKAAHLRVRRRARQPRSRAQPVGARRVERRGVRAVLEERLEHRGARGRACMVGRSAKMATWAASGGKATASRWDRRCRVSPPECVEQPRAFRCSPLSPWWPARGTAKTPL